MSPSLTNEKSAGTKAMEAYHRLRTLIIDGKFKSGDRLTAAAAAKLVRMGRGPIRESLLRLEAEGLLMNRGNRRSRVIVYTEDEDRGKLLERYELREQIEAGAARLAAKNMSGRQIGELRQLAQRTVELERTGDREQRYKSNYEFHRYLVANCGNALMFEFWQNFHLVPTRPRTTRFEDEIRSHIAPNDRVHPNCVDVVEAIAQHDQDRAEEVMRRMLRLVTIAIEQTVWGTEQNNATAMEGVGR
jgi:DNA-binding GntR family transcriptional regulator